MNYRRILDFGILFSCLLFAQESIPWKDDGFDSNQLKQQEPSLLAPERFSMIQSYSVSYVYGSGFGSYSKGVYLNTVVYQFDFPLALSFDFGFYTPFHQNFNERDPWWFDEDAKYSAVNFLLPRVGLEYNPTPNVSLSLQVFNMPDAAKAYSPFWRSYPCRSYTWTPDYCTPWHLRPYRYRR